MKHRPIFSVLHAWAVHAAPYMAWEPALLGTRGDVSPRNDVGRAAHLQCRPGFRSLTPPPRTISPSRRSRNRPDRRAPHARPPCTPLPRCQPFTTRGLAIPGHLAASPPPAAPRHRHPAAAQDCFNHVASPPLTSPPRTPLPTALRGLQRNRWPSDAVLRHLRRRPRPSNAPNCLP